MPALPGFTRREAITAATGALVATYTAGLAGRGAAGRRRSRVDIVGAGLAGLACAARLVRAGVDARVWEARARLGGRTLTDLDLVPGGWVECGGEFIDADHSAIRRLCAAHRVRLQDLDDLEIPGSARDLVAGRIYSAGWAARPDARLAARAERDLRTRGEARLDRMSGAEWLGQAIAGWPSSAFARYRIALVRAEFGVSPSALSALWLVTGLAAQARTAEMGGVAERYRIDGGTTRLVAALERAIGPGRIERGTRLSAVEAAQGRLALALTGPRGRRTEISDRVVITVPPTVLAGIDMRGSGVPPQILRAITSIGMGTNAKLIIPFEHSGWERAGWNGEGISDTALGATWQATMGQHADGVALTTLVGGSQGSRIAGPAHGSATEASIRERLSLIDRIAVGAATAARPGAVVHAWARDPFSRGSYSAARPGQDARWPDLQRPYGRVHFAGEHADDEYSGYMEGAVRSGQRAARQVLARL